MQTLKDRIAVVAGATRGAGHGIACMLEEAGATVYCTGRSARDAPSAIGRKPSRRQPYDNPTSPAPGLRPAFSSGTDET
jgi:NAD(P)-dependent dehydrogenase (short-subunit alcohol dehydrogenase family)